MPQQTVKLRPYQVSDETPAMALWQRSWQRAYPQIDFSTRMDWFRAHWAELQSDARIVVAEFDAAPDRIAGFVTVSPRTGYLDQIVVAPELWGGGLAAALLAEAKRISPSRLDLLVNKDNARAIRFYEKHGFKYAGDDVNPVSGRPVNRMSWRP